MLTLFEETYLPTQFYMEYNNIQVRNPQNNITPSIIGGTIISIKTSRCALNKEAYK